MHPEISNEDIVYAERILFGERGKFDQERKDFIKNLDSIDLQAVPGSGKTTALLAKLLILQKNQPFIDEAGILVISHTNKAVEIIRNKLGIHCPNLFRYPNYVGTIQSFVDRYLAEFALINKYGVKISKVDTELYQQRLLRKFNAMKFLPKYGKLGPYFFGRHINRAKAQARSNKSDPKTECLRLINNEISKLYIDLETEAICRWDTGATVLKDISNQKYKGLRIIIDEVLKKGLIPYEFAYELGRCSLLKYPLLTKLLQKRFRYVFVDEMQDMESHQIDILEELFRLKKTKNQVYQRVGDNNQSIFSGFVHEDAKWKSGEIQKSLKRSIRLSSVNAQKVEPFGIKTAEIIGSNEEVNENLLHPHLILFDDNTVRGIIPHFSKLIRNYQKEGKIPYTPGNGFKAVGWVKEKEKDGRLSIKDYFPSYNIEIAKSSSSDLNSLEDYIFRAEKKNTSKAFHEALIDSILVTLRLEEVKNIDERNFTKRTLFNYLIENEDLKKQSYYDELLLGLYKMCSICIKKDINELRPVFSSFISTFMSEIFRKNKLSDKTASFIEETRIVDQEDDEELFENNFYRDEDISIEVGTVHSVKGETHCATLYMETFYHKKYESERLLDQLKGSSFDDERKFHKQSTKVAYVGLSRPTHFLCFAAHNDRVQDHLTEIEENGWKIDNELIEAE
ncbi:MAG: UvrD-helicase domain-containing protein [Candidatus Paceibacterota bacterium]